MLLPNYVIVDILNILFSTIRSPINNFSLIETISLVSREWKDSILPRLHIDFGRKTPIDRFFYRAIDNLLNRGLTKLSLFILCINSQQIDLMERLTDNFKYVKELGIVCGPTVSDQNQQQIVDLIKGFKSLHNIEILHLSHCLLNCIDCFRNLKHISLNNFTITMDKIIDLIYSIKPQSLKLQSTPYNNDDDTNYDSLIKEVMKCHFITSFQIFNYFMEFTATSFIEILQHPTITKLSLISNLPDELPTFEIRNTVLKRIYYDQANYNISDYWQCISNLKTINVNLLTKKTVDNLIAYHNKNLKNLVITRFDFSVLCDLIASNLSLKKLSTLFCGHDKSIPEMLVKSLKLNNNLTSLKLADDNHEVFKEILRLDHPTLIDFTMDYPHETTLEEFEQDIINNKSLRSLSIIFKFTNNGSGFQSIISILANNKTLLHINFPQPIVHEQLSPNQLDSLDNALSQSPQWRTIHMSVSFNIKNNYNVFSLIQKVSLVSREWKDVILPRIFIKFHCVRDEEIMRRIDKLLQRDFVNLSIDLYIQDQSDEVMSLLLNAKSSQVTFDSLKLHMDKIEWSPPDHYKPIHTLGLGGYIEDKTSYQKFMETIKNYQSFRDIETINIISVNLIEHLSAFKKLTSIDLSSLRIQLDPIIEMVKQIKPKTLTLQSTPYGYGISDQNFDRLFNVIREIDTIESFEVFNYFLVTTNKSFVDMLHHPSLTILSVTNLKGEMPNPLVIRNSKLKKLYSDIDSTNLIVDAWDCQSSLKSLRIDLLNQQTLDCIKKFHSVNLQKLDIDKVDDLKVFIDLLDQKNLSFKMLNISSPISTNTNYEPLLKSIKSNQTITSFKFSNEEPEFLKEFLKITDKDYDHLTLNTNSSTIEDYVKEISENTTFSAISIRTRPMEFDSSFKAILKILKHNKTLINVEFPSPTESQVLNETQYEKLKKVISNSPQLLKIKMSGYRQKDKRIGYYDFPLFYDALIDHL
ncbi:hypothetical protein DLAC_06830 [Tieghemostelium lacteum]|uniref:Uncharacterized protein n=1 Tax=Tieghemostelium lacteum TaxID=361077 RepID=A0A151ZDK1_TIELA|nr:hypothetical protein DLAC_06830 [Tieghemostelium lacteum]|eukprot:KYQ92005.1 hypothetical protein DLAC_06830 [Tieghemostelium lacteum]